MLICGNDVAAGAVVGWPAGTVVFCAGGALVGAGAVVFCAAGVFCAGGALVGAEPLSQPPSSIASTSIDVQAITNERNE
jgi:hypothetical protein